MKKCSENMLQISRGTPMPKYYFNKVALQPCQISKTEFFAKIVNAF